MCAVTPPIDIGSKMKKNTTEDGEKGTIMYSKTCVKQPLSKRPKVVFQDQLSLNAGQKYCRMLQEEHSAILSTFINLSFVIKIFVLSVFEWPFYTGFTVLYFVFTESGSNRESGRFYSL